MSDNGIGMSRAEVVENIGTIAKSGTREFFQSLTGDQQKDANLIGQFGVGFYSSFVVADRVTLTTRQAGLTAEDGVRWESDGQGQYTLETVEKAGRGTEVVLHLRDGEDDLLTGSRLRGIIRKYSDHIALPIVMKSEEPDKDEDEVVNRASALWARPRARLPRNNTTSSISISRTISVIHWPMFIAAWRERTSTFCCCIFQVVRHLICGVVSSSMV